MEKIKSYFYGVQKEIERVRWPDKKSMVKYSTAVFMFSFFFAIFFYVINIAIVFIKDVLQ